MTEAEAKQAGIDVSERRSYVKVCKGDKTNFAPAVDDAEWYQIVSIPLGNGEKVGVVTSWEVAFRLCRHRHRRSLSGAEAHR